MASFFILLPWLKQSCLLISPSFIFITEIYFWKNQFTVYVIWKAVKHHETKDLLLSLLFSLCLEWCLTCRIHSAIFLWNKKVHPFETCKSKLQDDTSHCISHVSLFSILLKLWHLWLCWPERDCPSQGKLIPRDNIWIHCECAFHMHTNQSTAHTSNRLLHLPLILQDAVFPCLNYPRARYQATKDNTMLQSPLKSVKDIYPDTVCPVFLYLSYGNHNKPSAHAFPLPLLSPDQLWCFPMWPCMA